MFLYGAHCDCLAVVVLQKLLRWLHSFKWFSSPLARRRTQRPFLLCNPLRDRIFIVEMATYLLKQLQM